MGERALTPGLVKVRVNFELDPRQRDNPDSIYEGIRSSDGATYVKKIMRDLCDDGREETSKVMKIDDHQSSDPVNYVKKIIREICADEISPGSRSSGLGSGSSNVVGRKDVADSGDTLKRKIEFEEDIMEEVENILEYLGDLVKRTKYRRQNE